MGNFLNLAHTYGIRDQANSKSLDLQPIKKIETKTPIPDTPTSLPNNWQQANLSPAPVIQPPKPSLPGVGDIDHSVNGVGKIASDIINKINEKKANLRRKLQILSLILPKES